MEIGKNRFTAVFTRLFQSVNATVFNSLTLHFRKQNKPLQFHVLTIFTSLELSHPRFDFSSRTLWNYIVQCKVRGKTVFDCNAGTGWLSLYSAQRGAKVSVYDNREISRSIMMKNVAINNIEAKFIARITDISESSLQGLTFGFIFVQPVANKTNTEISANVSIVDLCGRTLSRHGVAVFFASENEISAFDREVLRKNKLMLRCVRRKRLAGSSLYEISRRVN